MSKFVFEVCADSVESALIAAEQGADRIELCSNLIIGGTTPSTKLYEEIRKYTDIPIRVLIRPRYGDFCYTVYEQNIMREEIAMFQEMGVQGIVTGILSPDGALDVEGMKYVLGDMVSKNDVLMEGERTAITLHRAFDMCKNPFDVVQQAIDLGVNTILTSGQRNTCVEGIDLLKNIKKIAADRIEILVGAGVDSDNIQRLYEFTGITSYHLSAKEIVESMMVYRNRNVNMGIKGFDEYGIYRTSSEELKKIIKVMSRY